MNLFDRPFSRTTVSGLVLAGVGLSLAFLAPDVLFVLFASLLVATLLYGSSNWMARRTGLAHWIALALFTAAILAGFVTLGFVAARCCPTRRVSFGSRCRMRCRRCAPGLKLRAGDRHCLDRSRWRASQRRSPAGRSLDGQHRQ